MGVDQVGDLNGEVQGGAKRPPIPSPAQSCCKGKQRDREENTSREDIN